MSRVARSVIALALVFFGAAVPTGSVGARVGDDARHSSVGRGVSDVYLVQLVELPVAAYEGGIAGFPATKPNAGRKLDKTSPNVARYATLLRSRHDAVANGIGAQRLYDYEYSFNGFAAPLRSEEH